MREFWVRVVSLICVVSLILGYNSVLQVRAKDEEIARLQAETQSKNDEDSSISSENDGVYRGEAEGFGGFIIVDVTVENGEISNIELVSADGEDDSYLNMAKAVISKIIEEQSTDVDVVSGATFSSTGIINAAQNALEKMVEE